MGDQQWAKSAWQYARHAPFNFVLVERQIEDMDRHWVMWKFDPQLAVDKRTAESFVALMTADNRQAGLRAAKTLKIQKDDGSISLSTLGDILKELTLVSRPRTERIQKEDCWGLPYICSCSTFACRAQCEHELYVQWLEGTGKVQFRQLADFTKAEAAPKSALGGGAGGRAPAGGRPPAVPGAWDTIRAVQEKKEAAMAKAAARKRKKEATAEDAIWTPRKSPKLAAVELGSTSILAGLGHRSFLQQYEALINVAKSNLAFDDALKNGVGRAVQTLHNDARTTAPAKQLSRQILDKWLAQKNARNSSAASAPSASQ